MTLLQRYKNRFDESPSSAGYWQSSIAVRRRGRTSHGAPPNPKTMSSSKGMRPGSHGGCGHDSEAAIASDGGSKPRAAEGWHDRYDLRGRAGRADRYFDHMSSKQQPSAQTRGGNLYQLPRTLASGRPRHFTTAIGNVGRLALPQANGEGRSMTTERCSSRRLTWTPS